jgi:hypothetical protein
MVGCVDFGGYHWEAAVGGTTVPFAVIPRCYAFPPPPLPTLVGPDFLTVAISHEVAEAASDPFPQSHPGYLASRDTGTARALALGPENGDFCAMVGSVNPPDIGSLVTRLWSNASASAGRDPCVPAPGRPYFSVTSDMPDTLDAPDPWDLTKTGKTIQTKGVKLAAGASKTIDLHLFSDAPTKDWDVSAEEQSITPALGFSFDRARGNDGATARLTITLNGALPDSGVTMFVVHSKQGDVTNDWYGLVGK